MLPQGPTVIGLNSSVGTGSVQLLTNQLNIINYKTTNPNSYEAHDVTLPALPPLSF
jgi:hypothetical protein